MPHRDPETGQFVADAVSKFDHLEMATWSLPLSVPAADLDGTTQQFYGENALMEGQLVVDWDDVFDRHAVGRIIRAMHRVWLQPTGTQTADSAAFGIFEISSSPALQAVTDAPNATLDGADFSDGPGAAGDFDIQVSPDATVFDDTIDLLGRPLNVAAQGPFTDGTNGPGGAGSAGEDDLMWDPISYDIDRRDELFVNAIMGAQNISDGPIGAYLVGQYVVGVDREV